MRPARNTNPVTHTSIACPQAKMFSVLQRWDVHDHKHGWTFHATETDPAKILSSSQGRTMFLRACPAAASWTCSVAAPSFCLRLDPLPSPNADLLLTWAQPICDRASCFFATRHRAQRKRLVHPQPVQRPF
jgi:hypothetical protein